MQRATHRRPTRRTPRRSSSTFLFNYLHELPINKSTISEHARLSDFEGRGFWTSRDEVYRTSSDEAVRIFSSPTEEEEAQEKDAAEEASTEDASTEEEEAKGKGAEARPSKHKSAWNGWLLQSIGTWWSPGHPITSSRTRL